MNTETTPNQKLGTNFNAAFGKELHDLGEKIERIAEKLKSSGNQADGDELYQVGDEVEHFFDKVKNAAFSGKTNEDNKESFKW